MSSIHYIWLGSSLAFRSKVGCSKSTVISFVTMKDSCTWITALAKQALTQSLENRYWYALNYEQFLQMCSSCWTTPGIPHCTTTSFDETHQTTSCTTARPPHRPPLLLFVYILQYSSAFVNRTKSSRLLPNAWVKQLLQFSSNPPCHIARMCRICKVSKFQWWYMKVRADQHCYTDWRNPLEPRLRHTLFQPLADECAVQPTSQRCVLAQLSGRKISMVVSQPLFQSAHAGKLNWRVRSVWSCMFAAFMWCGLVIVTHCIFRGRWFITYEVRRICVSTLITAWTWK